MKLTSQPLVSVVTPVYNTEKYLAECIESVLSQTYENWDYVIVNNCSTDRSLEIAQHCAQRDQRIRIHNNKEFLGLMQNQNNALRQISSESKYCKVVHADDWLFPECLARMVEVAETNPSVGIVGSYRLDENWVNLDGLPYSSPLVAGREVCRFNLLNDSRYYLFGSLTSLLIRSEIIRSRQAFLNESQIHGDKEACLEVLQDSDFGFVHQVLTYTRRHNESASSFSRRFHTHIIGDLIILKKYGPVYLSNEEYETTFRRLYKTYYRKLGMNLLKFREKEFWAYHKDELAKLGRSLNVPRLCASAFIVLYNRLLTKLKL